MVLFRLLLNSLLRWSRADDVAGLVIAAFVIRDGIEAWKGDAYATSVGMLLDTDDADDHDPAVFTVPAIGHQARISAARWKAEAS